MPDLVTSLLSIGSGGIVGLVLGLVGGGGSILAVPLLVYAVGVKSPHVAIGTSAVAVAASALGNLFPHWRNGNVKWACAAVFASAGVVGAFGGAAAAKAMDGQRLLALFGLVMIVVGALMLRAFRRRPKCETDERIGRQACARSRRHRLHGRAVLGIFRHWRWISDRSRPDARDRHASYLSDRDVAVRRKCLRRGHRRQLRRLRFR